MDRSQVREGYERLQKIYSNMPACTPDVVNEWFLVFSWMPAGVFNIGIDNYIANERYRPTPASLKDRCWPAYNEWKQGEKERVDSLGDDQADCKYCGGIGLFCAQDYNDDARYTWFECGCTGTERGKKCLFEALHDPRWEFSASWQCFVKKKTWVGNDIPLNANEQVVYDALERGAPLIEIAGAVAKTLP